VARGGPTPRPRHVPQRTCVACRQGDAKRALVRIVRLASGAVRVDPGGKLSGRGAYLHDDPDCWTLAFKRAILPRALRIPAIADDDMAALRDRWPTSPSSPNTMTERAQPLTDRRNPIADSR